MSKFDEHTTYKYFFPLLLLCTANPHFSLMTFFVRHVTEPIHYFHNIKTDTRAFIHIHMKTHGFYIYVQIHVYTHTPHTPLAWSSLDSLTGLPTPYEQPTVLRLSKRLCPFSLHFIYGEYDPKNKFAHIQIYVNNLVSLPWSQQMQFSSKNVIPKTVEQIIFLHCPFDHITLLFAFLVSYPALSHQIHIAFQHGLSPQPTLILGITLYSVSKYYP